MEKRRINVTDLEGRALEIMIKRNMLVVSWLLFLFLFCRAGGGRSFTFVVQAGVQWHDPASQV